MPHAEMESVLALQKRNDEIQQGYEELNKRIKRTSLRIPAADLASPELYVDMKLKDAKHSLDGLYARHADLMSSLTSAVRHPTALSSGLEARLADVQSQIADKQIERAVLAEQGAALAADLRNELHVTPNIDDAYLTALAPKLSATAPQLPHAAPAHGWTAEVLHFYSALRPDAPGAHCCLFGRHRVADLRAARLVPLSLQCRGLAYLLGCTELGLDDLRNALPLSAAAARALDDGVIVFAPVDAESQQAKVGKWRCIVVDSRRQNELAVGDRHWKVRHLCILRRVN